MPRVVEKAALSKRFCRSQPIHSDSDIRHLMYLTRQAGGLGAAPSGQMLALRGDEGGRFHCSHQQLRCHSPGKCSHASVALAQRSWEGALTLQPGNLQKESPRWSSLISLTPPQPEAPTAQPGGLAEAGTSGWSPRKLTRASSPFPGDPQEPSSAERAGLIPGKLPRLKNNNMEL